MLQFLPSLWPKSTPNPKSAGDRLREITRQAVVDSGYIEDLADELIQNLLGAAQRAALRGKSECSVKSEFPGCRDENFDCWPEVEKVASKKLEAEKIGVYFYTNSFGERRAELSWH